MRKKDVPISLHADSDVGKGLLQIIDSKDTLYDVRILDESVSDVREELRDDLEQNLLHEQYECTEEGDLYVSFWHSGNDYFLHTQDEMEAYLSQDNGMKFGG